MTFFTDLLAQVTIMLTNLLAFAATTTTTVVAATGLIALGLTIVTMANLTAPTGGTLQS